jgi:hypothetical protein
VTAVGLAELQAPAGSWSWAQLTVQLSDALRSDWIITVPRMQIPPPLNTVSDVLSQLQVPWIGRNGGVQVFS